MTRFVLVTPVFNCANYIQATLDSVDSQTDADWVHYVIDGGSTDGTLELLRESADADGRRCVVSERDGGMYDALFKGFERSAADGFTDPRTVYVWINGDDLLMPWALAVLRKAFDETGAEWIMAAPAHWDGAGRLGFVGRNNWHPRWLVRAGQFNGRSLGWIQQESTFFTRSLIENLSEPTIRDIRAKKLAGDFIMWREFAKYARPVSIMVPVAGFRQHATNASTSQMDQYYSEIARNGLWLPPSGFGRLLGRVYRLLGSLASYRVYRRERTEFFAALSRSMPGP